MKIYFSAIVIVVVPIFIGLYSCTHKTGFNKDDKFQKEGVHYPIVSSEYNRFILIKTTSKDYCKSLISEYCELNVPEVQKDTATNFDVRRFQLSQKGMWVIMKIPQTIDFYHFHNLVGWMWGYGDSADLPLEVFGFSLHKEDKSKSYYVELDRSNNWGDVVVGANQTGKSISIYLPDAYIDGGNMLVLEEDRYDYDKAVSEVNTADIDLGSMHNHIWEDFDVKHYY